MRETPLAVRRDRPRDFRVTLPSRNLIKAEHPLKDAVFERRSCGDGSKGSATATGRWSPPPGSATSC
jgi:hypothetical protein